MENLRQELISIEKIQIGYKIHFNCAQCGILYGKNISKAKLNKCTYLFCSIDCVNKSQSTGALKQLIKERFIEKYGVENISQLDSIKKQKIETTLKNYGVPNASQSNIIKTKKVATSIKNYGVSNPNQSPIVRAKTEKTCLERYGKTSYLGTNECRDDIRNFSLEAYGTEHFMKSEKFLNEVYNPAIFKIYGVNNKMQAPNVVQKVKDTCMEKYGVDNALKTQLARDNFYKFLEDNKEKLTSKLEDKFYENLLLPLCIELNLNVSKQKNVKCWFVDFYIPEKDLYIQFDGIYWHGINETIEFLKEKVETYGKKSLWQGILNNKHKDAKQNKWFQKANLNLIRITDEEYLIKTNEVETKLRGILT